MLDLISTSEELHYENYRQAQMETRKFGEPKVKKLDNPKFKEEEEMLRKKFTEQVKAEEARFRQWEQHVSFFYKTFLSGLTYLPFFLLVDRGARPSKQGPRDGSQCYQATRSGVGEPSGWLWPRLSQTISCFRLVAIALPLDQLCTALFLVWAPSKSCSGILRLF